MSKKIKVRFAALKREENFLLNHDPGHKESKRHARGTLLDWTTLHFTRTKINSN